jgi:ketosteroid isomerase-like protein
MKNNIAKGLFITFILVSISACITKKEESQATVIDKEQIKKEIQAKEDLFAATYNAGEKKSLGYYADDAISFAQNRPPLVGKDAIVEFLLEGLENNINSNKISFTTNEVFVSNDGVQVVEIGFYKVVDSTNTIVNSGNYMSLFEKRDGNYVSVRDMSVSNMPIELPTVED